MGAYILKRIGQTIIVLLIISTLTFMLLSLLPGDPVMAILGEDITQEQYDIAFKEMGLDKPVAVAVRYFNWVKNMIKGDFGYSFQFKQPVVDLVKERLPVTLFVALISLIISMVVGVLFGIICAVFRGHKIDTIITVIANICSCAPSFWLSVLVVYIFSVKLNILPSYGFTFPWDDFGTSVKQLAMPLFCLCLSPLASTTRQTRSAMLEVIRQDYVRTARSKGLKERSVIYIHALKNALIPILTLFGARVGHLFGGSVFIEQVFVIPGMGLLLLRAIQVRDVPMVQVCVLLISAFAIITNLVVDIIYAYVDPRIRYVED